MRGDDLLLAPRYAVSFDLSDIHTLLLGASAALGPNSRAARDPRPADTQIYGADVTWKWKPTTSTGGFPFLAWQTEPMWRRYRAGYFNWDLNHNALLDPGEIATPLGAPAVLPAEWLTDYGFYTQLLYGFRRGWVARTPLRLRHLRPRRLRTPRAHLGR